MAAYGLNTLSPLSPGRVWGIQTLYCRNFHRMERLFLSGRQSSNRAIRAMGERRVLITSGNHLFFCPLPPKCTPAIFCIASHFE